MPPTLHIVDGNGFLHRAYHARQKSAAPVPMGGVQAFGAMLRKLAREHQVTHGVVVFDVPGPTWRHERWPGYKAGRKAPDAELVAQLPRFAPMARACGWPTSALANYEGDDLVAGVAGWWRQWHPAAQIRIHASDKDLMQLVTDQVHVVDPVRGRTFGPADVQTLLGVPPALVGDLLAYQGDEIDGVPGVPGVGKVTAVQWCQQYANIAQCILDNPRVRGKHPLATPEGRERLRLARELVGLRAPDVFRFDTFTPRSGDAGSRAWEVTLEPPVPPISTEMELEAWRLGTVPTEDGRPWQFEHNQLPCWERPTWPPGRAQRAREDYEERAAILEADGKLTRAEAEAQAYAYIRARPLL